MSIEVTEATFNAEVVERSKTTPVVVDLWAAWCGPCRTLSPILERLEAEAAGGWILATVDVDANQRLAARFGVQGIPAVHGFRDGREVARFVGALPEQQVRAWLQQLGPTEADLAIDEGRAAEERGDDVAALDAYRRALAHEPARTEARAAIARLELAARAADAADPLADADRAFARGDVETAVRELIERVREGGDLREPARARLVSLLDTLPADDSRALQARRDLANALY